MYQSMTINLNYSTNIISGFCDGLYIGCLLCLNIPFRELSNKFNEHEMRPVS